MSDDKDALIYLASVRIEELNAENAKLRHDLEEANNQAEEVCIENAKLRELVRDMYKSMDVSCQFGHAIPAGTMAHVKNRAIGLGVEVGA